MLDLIAQEIHKGSNQFNPTSAKEFIEDFDHNLKFEVKVVRIIEHLFEHILIQRIGMTVIIFNLFMRGYISILYNILVLFLAGMINHLFLNFAHSMDCLYDFKRLSESAFFQ